MNGLLIENNILKRVDASKLGTIEGLLIIPNGVTEIGADAFEDFHISDYKQKIKEIILPDSLEKIGERAFKYLTELKKINFPYLLDSIDDSAFWGCISLKNIQLNEGLTYIGKNAFRDCALQSVNVPSTVTFIGRKAFRANELNKITISTKNKIYKDCGSNIIYNRTTDELVQGSNNAIIPEGTKSIAESAFAFLGNLNDIILPDSVEKIGESAFACCNINKIKLNECLKYIDDLAFNGCTEIKELTLPKTIEQIGNYIITDSTIEKLNIWFDTNIITSREVINNKSLKEIFVENIDKSSIFYNQYKNIIKSLALEDLIEIGKSINEINKIYKNKGKER